MKYLNPDRVQTLLIEDSSKKYDKHNFRFQHLISVEISPMCYDIVPFLPYTITNFSCRDLLFGENFIPDLENSSFFSNLYTLRLSTWMPADEKMPDQVPSWLLKLPHLQILTLSVKHGWQIQLLVDNLPKLKEISLTLHIREKKVNENLFHQLSKLKYLKVLCLTWLTDSFHLINFQQFCTLSQVTFFEMDYFNPELWSVKKGCNGNSLLKSLPRILPNLHHLDLEEHDFQPKLLLTTLKQLKKLKKFRLKTLKLYDDFVQNQLIPFCDQKNICLLWNYDCCATFPSNFHCAYKNMRQKKNSYWRFLE